MGHPVDAGKEDASPVSAARMAGYISTLGLFSYLPLRALQEGFYLEFNATGSEVGLDETTVLTRAAVMGAFLVGALSLVLIGGGAAGRRSRRTLGRHHVLIRVLVVCLVALLPVLMQVVNSLLAAMGASAATMPASEVVRLEWLFVPIAAAFGAGLLYEDSLTGLKRIKVTPPFFLLAVGVLSLAFISTIAFGAGSQIASDTKLSGSSSLTTELLLSHPIRSVVIERVNQPQQGGGDMPDAGLLLGIHGGVTFVYAEDRLWRLPQSSIIMASGH